MARDIRPDCFYVFSPDKNNHNMFLGYTFYEDWTLKDLMADLRENARGSEVFIFETTVEGHQGALIYRKTRGGRFIRVTE